MDTPSPTGSFTAFAGHRRLSTGSLAVVALAVKRAVRARPATPVLAYDDATGRVVELDTRGTDADVLARLPAAAQPDDAPRGRGRPRLGVVGREVTLLPRHWDWLAAQPGGASVALRKLVEHAKKHGSEAERRRRRHDAAYHFMSSLAGDLPGFEEAARALFADDAVRFATHIARWPRDVRAYATALAFPGSV